MPHPYLGAERPNFGATALLQRPGLAAYIGAIATTDEMIQESWGIILAQALTADARIGTELYLALTGSNAQAVVLNKAVELATEDEPEIKAEFVALLAKLKGRSGERNRVIHGRWGYVTDREDIIILGERNWLPKAVAALNHYYEREWQDGEEFAIAEPEFACTTYCKKDFENIMERQDTFLASQHAFIGRLRDLQMKRREKRRQQEDWRLRGILTAPRPGLLGQPETNPEEPR